MRQVTTVTRRQRVILCPECGKHDFEIVGAHWGGEWGPWFCDECGYGFCGRTDSEGESFIETWRERIIPTVVTLRSAEPVTVRVAGHRRVRDGANSSVAEYEEGEQYYYDEHTCPVNFLGVEEVLNDAGDEDPHGIFAWIKTEAVERVGVRGPAQP